MTKKAVILFSGGLDSTTCLGIAKSQGFNCYALTFQYGQKNHLETESAKQLAQRLEVVEHKFLSIPLEEIRGSSMTDPNMPVPDYQGDGRIPNTYVPARNTIFLSFAIAWAEVIGAEDIFYGANCIDYSEYPDCRPDYLRAYEYMANLATKVGIEGQPFKIHAPLMYLDKADIIRKGVEMGIDYGKTISCYRINPEGLACGTCASCTYRKKGFLEANIQDPTPYLSVA